jgi:hypothetical protein
MITQSTLNLALVLSLGVWIVMSGLLAMQTIWVFAQGNLSQIINQMVTKLVTKLVINPYLPQSQDNKVAHHLTLEKII